MGKAAPVGECIEGGGRYFTLQPKNYAIHTRDLWNTSPKISFAVELLLLGLRIVG